MKYKELIVGVFAAVAIGLLYLGFNYLKGRDFFSDNAVYFVVYPNVSELAVSNPVLVNGYAIGRVKQISLLQRQGNPVLVAVEVEGSVRIGKNAKATLSSALLGNKSILLDLGDISDPMQPGDTIPGELAKGMLETLSETASLGAYDLQSTLKKFNGIIDDLTLTLETINPVIHKFQETPGKLNNLIDKSGENLNQVSVSIQEISDKLKGSLNQLDPTLNNLRVITDSIKRLQINETLAETRKTLASVNDLMQRLKRGDNTAGKLLTQDSLYNNLNRAISNLDSLATHFNDTPKDFLGPLARTPKQMERARRKEAARQQRLRQ